MKMEHKRTILRILSIVIFIGYCTTSFSEELEIKKGNSSLINETTGTISVDYNLCEYDYHLDNKGYYNEKCSLSTINIDNNSVANFELNPITIDSNTTHYKHIYVKKIRAGTSYQYFISDMQDGIIYDESGSASDELIGVNKRAFYCSFFSSIEIHIYATEKGVICH